MHFDNDCRPRHQPEACRSKAIAISGDNQPSHTHVAKFVANPGSQIKPVFAQVLMSCDAQGLNREV